MKQFQLEPKNFLLLIVDDTEANIRLLSHVLRGDGFNIIAAFNGEDCLELARERKPDLILLDVMMPDVSGFDVCKQINLDPELKDIPVIFLSALTEIKDKVEGFEVGGVDYITKPFQKDEVLARIKTHLSLSQLQKERDERIEILKKREQELRDLNVKKDDLVRMVSHDIRNPITGIIGLSKLMRVQQGISEEDRISMLKVMEESGNKLLDLVKKVLDNDAKSKKLDEFIFINTDVVQLIEKVISINSPKAILKDIQLSFHSELLMNEFLLDPIKMEIAINNLVSNALKFTSSNGIVLVSMSNTDEDLIIKVIDNGIGIPDSMQKQILLPGGNELHSQAGTDGELGSGLGLHVVKNYVEAHNGDILVESSENVGTTFTVRIPIKEKD
ncbi:MAG: hybrid sensor histidine kinase/response regulator [Balneolales bacterium]|nr:hybrid sensor histidine kinase/response regulator [Balneolales bacterium]